jgi:hypothetical protein
MSAGAQFRHPVSLPEAAEQLVAVELGRSAVAEAWSSAAATPVHGRGRCQGRRELAAVDVQRQGASCMGPMRRLSCAGSELHDRPSGRAPMRMGGPGSRHRGRRRSGCGRGGAVPRWPAGRARSRSRRGHSCPPWVWPDRCRSTPAAARAAWTGCWASSTSGTESSRPHNRPASKFYGPRDNLMPESVPIAVRVPNGSVRAGRGGRRSRSRCGWCG